MSQKQTRRRCCISAELDGGNPGGEGGAGQRERKEFQRPKMAGGDRRKARLRLRRSLDEIGSGSRKDWMRQWESSNWMRDARNVSF